MSRHSGCCNPRHAPRGCLVTVSRSAGRPPGAVRQTIENALQTVHAQQFAQWLGAAAYERTAERRGGRNGGQAPVPHSATRAGCLETR